MSDRSRAVRWLSRVYGSLLQRMRVREAQSRIQRRRPATRGSELQELEPRLLLATTAANTTIGTFTGGDANEGLDLEGKFVYAVNVNGPAVGPIRDASFTSSASTAGLSLFATDSISSFYTPDFGNSPNDNALETVMKSISFTVSPNPVRFTLANLTVGMDYKLQLLLGGPSNNRGFDIYANAGVDVKIVDDFSVTDTQGGVNATTKGGVVTYQFTATQSTLQVRLDGSTTTFSDKNPILNGLTLESLTPLVTLGPVVNATEGFGFGSTIDGFSKALDVSTANATANVGDKLQLAKNKTYTQEFLVYPQANAAGELYSWKNTSNPVASTTVGAFSGGDLGEGLDLDGKFTYAVNVRGPAVGTIRDATFTNDSATGVSVTAPFEILNFVASDFGSSANDNALESVMQSIRWNANPGKLAATLGKLVVGTEYKLQLLFEDVITDRGFDVFMGGTKIVSSFFPGAVQGSGQLTKKGAVITHQFVATATSLSITLDGSATTARDKNPILNGLTLEDLGARSPILGTVKTYNSGRGLQIGGPAGQQTFDVALNPDAWNHVAQTFDGSQSQLYVNGVLVQSTPAAADLNFIEPTQIALGSQPGALDELRVWNVARTQAEIQKSMYTALEGTEKGLQGYWPFDSDLKDKSTRSADFVKSSGTASFFNNPQPQVGSVDVVVDQPVTSAVGLFVGYTITGGTAIENDDFYSSRFRTVSFQPSTERLGVIIPQGETRGKIYFLVRPDAISETTESVSIQLEDFTFATSKYVIGTNKTATVSITDNGAYRPGVALFDADGRALLPDATGVVPYYVPGNSTLASLDVALTSQPASDVTLTLSPGNGFFNVNGTRPATISLVFTKDNWDQRRRVQLGIAIPGVTKTFVVISQSGSTSYLATPVNFPYTSVPPNTGKVGEGNAGDSATLIPTVQIAKVRDAKEGDDQGGAFHITLDTPAPAGGLDIGYRSTLNELTTIGAFSGGDVGEGLDLDGEFPYAVNLRGGAVGLIRDANFTTDSVAGVVVTSLFNILNFATPDYGPTTNDDRLETVMQSIRWTSNPNQILTQLSGLVPGVEYKLQLLFQENGADRGFDVTVGGTKIADDFNPGRIQGGKSATSRGAVITYQFVAQSSTLNFQLDGLSTPFADKNPIFNAFTLEKLPQAAEVPLNGVVHVPEGALSADLRIVIPDNSIAAGASRTLTTSLVNDFVRYTVLNGDSRASLQIIDNDQARIVVGNFSENPASSPSTEPNETVAEANDLGTLIPGTSFTSNLFSSDDTDIFRFTIDPAVGPVDFIQVTGPNIGGMTVELLNASGNSIALMNGSQAIPKQYFFGSGVTVATTYQVKINGYRSGATDYQVSFLRRDTSTEPNNSTQTATNLGTVGVGVVSDSFLRGASSESPTDPDFYKFQLDDQVAEMSSVNLRFAANQPMTLTLYDSTGRLLDTRSTAATTGTQSTISLPLGAAVQRGNGVYFVRVTPQSPANSWNYKLDFAGQAFNRAGGIFLPSYSPVVVEESASTVVSKRLGLRLDSQPSAPVTLQLTTTSTGTTRAGTVTPETLTFTPTNWNLYQGVTVTPIDDLLPDGDQSLSIVASATSSDLGYNNKVLKFDALVLDNEDPPAPAVVDRTQSADLPLVFLTGMGQAVAESTSTLSYNVALSKPVSSDTYVGFAFDEGTATLGQDFTVSTGFVRDFRSMDFGVGGIKIAAGATVPAFADIDRDGDVDLLVGSASGPMQFYRNVGSKTTPRFAFQSGTSDPFSSLGGPALGGYTHPAFADVDGDGRIDLVVGSQTGLNFYRNDGTTTSPGVRFVAMSISPFPALATLNGSFFAPTFADLDGDGDQDLFVPRRGDTNVAYFERTGTATFTRNDAKLTTAGIGGLGTTDTPTIGFADLDGDRDLDAFIGLSTATFARLNGGTRTSPSFPTAGFARFREVTSAVKDAAWTTADLNGDGIPEEIGGDVGGRLRAFTSYQALLIPKGSTRATVTLAINNDLIGEGTVDPAKPQVGKKEDIGVRVLESPFYSFGKYTVKKVVENGVEKDVDVPFNVTDTYDADQDGNKTEILPAVYAGTLGIQDNDTAGFVTQNSDATVTEGGKRVAFGVKLATQPIADVSVYVGSSDVTEGVIVNGTNAGAETTTLTFTPANWNVFQTVNIAGVNDRYDDGDRPFTVLVSSTSDDVPYRQLTGPKVNFVNTDDETAGIVVTSPQATANGSPNVFSVQLQTEPIGQVFVTMTPENDQIRINGAPAGTPVTITFDSLNWTLRQLVQVTSVDDGFVEYIHKSSVRFTVETGRKLNGPTVADLSTKEKAVDLGDIGGGLIWTNLPFSTTIGGGAWFKFTLPEMGGPLDFIRTTAAGLSVSSAPRLSLYNLQGAPVSVSGTPQSLSLNGLRDGEYLLNVVGDINLPRGFTLSFDGADRQFEKLTLATVPFSIADNDVPTANLVSGPSASEVFSTPSYFAVKLNAPAPAGVGDAGIRVNFELLNSGRATFGTSTSTLHDFSLSADFFDPVTRKGYVRVAPGDVQANIGIIPVDDKLVEDLPLRLRELSFNSGIGDFIIRIAVDNSIGDPSDRSPLVLAAGTIVKGRLPSGREITVVVKEKTDLIYGTYGTPQGGLIAEYAAAVKVTGFTADDFAAGVAVGANTEYRGSVQSEDVQVRILPGDGYILPLATDKQTLNPRDPAVQSNIANFDPAHIAASVTIKDDDVAGIQLVRIGDDGNLAEGETARYGVALTAEPKADVTVTLSSDGQMTFGDPTTVDGAKVKPATYTLRQTLVATGPNTTDPKVELHLGSLVKTDLGWAAAIDARLQNITVNEQTVERNLALKMFDTTTKANGDLAAFQIPSGTAVDAAGVPVAGNWDQFQRLIVTNLTPQSSAGVDYFEVSLTLAGGAEKVVRIDVGVGKEITANTKTFTFRPADWFKFQEFNVTGKPNAVAEPGNWHQGMITATLASPLDAAWDGAPVPGQLIRLADQQLQGGQTAQALAAGFAVLRDSLDSLKLPLVGNLLTAAPEVGGFFDSSLAPLTTTLKSQNQLSATELAELSQSAQDDPTTADPTDEGFLDEFSIVPEATEDQITLHITMEKTWHIGSLDLSTDIGLDALGLSLQTSGGLIAEVKFKLEFVFGLSRTFGFFIDTAQTGLDVDATVTLDNFSGTGALGFLQVDFEDDSENPSELGIHFHAGLNDLDNYQTLQFFDINGDGMLASGDFQAAIGVDVNPANNLIDDANNDGNPDTVVKTVAEPFLNVNPRGVPVDLAGAPADFPTVSSLGGTALANAKNADWNGSGTFDEAVSITNEGVYRTRTLNGKTIVYFDSNNNGRLEIGKRNVDPFNSSWSALTTAQKNKSEIWIAGGTRRWTTAQNTVNEFQIQTTGVGTAAKFYFDSNGDGILSTTEEISAKLRKQLDKNKDGVLKANIQKDGEGTLLQGKGIAFADANGNGLLDYNEKFVNSGFGDTTFPETEDGQFAGATSPFTVQGAGTGTVYIDLNGNGFDSLDPQAVEGEEIVVPETSLDGKSMFVTIPVVKDSTGKRFLDFNKNGVRDLPTKPGDPIVERYIGDPNAVGNQSIADRFHIGDLQTSFTFFDSEADGKLGIRDFAAITVAGQRFIDLDFNGVLTESEEGETLEPSAEQNNTFDTTGFPANVPVVQMLNDGDRLTLKELLNFTRQVRSQNTRRTDQLKAGLDLFEYSFRGGANLGLHAVTSIGGNEAFPSFSFDLAVNFPLFNFGNEAEAGKTGFTVDFNHVTMQLGTFLQDFAAPIIQTVDDLLAPIKPIVQVLNADTKVFGALGLEGAFESDGRPGVSLLEVAKVLAPADKKPAIETAIKFATILSNIIDVSETLNETLSSGDNATIEFGDFSLSDLRAASDDPANNASHARQTALTNGQQPAQARTRAANGATSTLNQATGVAAQTAMVDATAKKSNVFKKLGQLEGFKFNLFNPDTVMSLLMGEEAVDIVTYDVPDFKFDFSILQKFRIWGPLAGLIQGGFSVSTDLAVGFDTAGLDEWKEDDFAPSTAYKVFDGFYFNDLSPSGFDKNELQVNAFIAVGAGLDLGIVSGFVRGGIRGEIGLDLVDQGERSGESDGKVRGSDIIAAFQNNPLDLFELNGKIEAFLGVLVEVDFFFFSEVVYEKDFATFKLAEFKLDTSGFSGSSDFGRAQAGPISGGFVWLDANNNLDFDVGEPSTTTDVDGNYQLFIPDGYNTGSGIVRIRGGVDTTTGLTHKSTLSQQLGDLVATPFTTLANEVAVTPIDEQLIDFDANSIIDGADSDLFQQYFTSGDLRADLNRDGVVDDTDTDEFLLFYEVARQGGTPSYPQAQKLILLAVGLDPNLDLSTLAHLDASLADDPRAKEVLVQVDAYGGLVTGAKAWLAGAAGIPSDSPLTDTILSNAVNRAIARRIVTGHTDLTDFDTVHAIVADALEFANQAFIANGLPNRIDPLVAAPRTAAVANVLVAGAVEMQILANEARDAVELAALVTKVKLNNASGRSDDLYAFGLGGLTESELLALAGRVDDESLARIRGLSLPPYIAHINDFHLLEGSSTDDTHFVAIDLDTPRDVLQLSIASDNPGLLPAENVTVTPQPDFYDWTLAIHPVANASGVAHITLTVTDEAGNHNSRTFAVTVKPVNDAPLARPDALSVVGEFPLKFDPRANDFDADGDLLNATVLDQPQHGRLIANDDGTFTYIADSGFSGRDTATYALGDGYNGVDTGTLTFDVSAALTAVFTPVTPDPRNAGVPSVDVTFSRAVDPRTLSISDFRMTRNGSPNLLGPAQQVTYVSGTTWRISGLTAPTIPLGVYEISVDARGVKDLSGNSGTNTAFDRWLMDYVPPTSRVNPLPAVATSASFTLNVTGSDLDIAGIAPSSGLDLYQIYVSTDGKPFVLYTTGKFSEGTSVNFTADGAHLYLFRSVSRDLAGNTEPKSAFAADAAIVVPDLFAPDTQVAGVNTATSKFTVSMQGVDNGGGTLAAFDLYVSVDGSTDSLVTRVPAGVADAQGVYRASVQYQAISDGLPHNYRFYTRGIDVRGNAEEAPATPADVVVSATFAPAPLTVAGFDINNGEAQRSLVRVMQVAFAGGGNLAGMVASVNDSNGGNDQIRLKRFNIDGTGAGLPVVLTGKVTAVGNTLVIDLGGRGLDDGYYALELDFTGDGTIDRTLRFHRLFGDVNGDGVVDGVDYVAIAGQLNRANAAPYFDLNFDGRVDVNDLVTISRLLGRRIGRGLALDD